MKHVSIGLSAIAVAIMAFSAPAAFAEPQIKPQTKQNLEAAMHGEAYAHLKYKAYADAARKNGHPELARVFDETANIEANEHFASEAGALGLAKSERANLLDSMAGEHYENTKMYVKFAKQAEAAGDTKVAELFREIAADEGDHYEKYKAELDKLQTSAQ